MEEWSDAIRQSGDKWQELPALCVLHSGERCTVRGVEGRRGFVTAGSTVPLWMQLHSVDRRRTPRTLGSASGHSALATSLGNVETQGYAPLKQLFLRPSVLLSFLWRTSHCTLFFEPIFFLNFYPFFDIYLFFLESMKSGMFLFFIIICRIPSCVPQKNNELDQCFVYLRR